MDFYKHERTGDLECFEFAADGRSMLVRDAEEVTRLIKDISTNIKAKPLLPSLTAFCLKNSKPFKGDFIRLRNTLGMDHPLTRRMHSLQLDPDGNFVTSQLPVFFDLVDQVEDQVRLDQPIDLTSQRSDPIILRELNNTLDNFAYADNSAHEAPDFGNASYQHNFDDYGGVDSHFDKNPLDFATPTNIFHRAQDAVTALEENLKQFNMRKDFTVQTGKSGSEYYGPDRIASSLDHTRTGRIRRNTSENRKQAKTKSPLRADGKPRDKIDWDVPMEETFKDSYTADFMNNPKSKASKPQVYQEEDLDKIEARFLKPPEYFVTNLAFQSIFTRDINEYNLKLELANMAARRSAQNPRSDPPAEEDYPPGDPFPQFDGGMPDFSPPVKLEHSADLRVKIEDAQDEEGRLVNDLLNYNQTDENIFNLEQKLRQQHNFKITEFKSYVLKKYISKLHGAGQAPSQLPDLPRDLLQVADVQGKQLAGLSFKNVANEIIAFWQAKHDIKITVQTCFLTILHLSIEHNLLLQQVGSDEQDFIISNFF